ncbi:MAG: ribosome recycling factor [Patescibacteria group bacterium]
MSYNFKSLKDGLTNIEAWLVKEFSSIRTGMASMSLLDNIRVESYGSFISINQVANVVLEDPKTLRIVPWDASQIKSIEKALTEADLGVSVSVDGKGIRLAFPDLTGERRESLVKMAKAKLEQAKVSVRGERDRVWNEIQEEEKKGGMGQDDKFRYKEEMQKIIDEKNEVLLGLFNKKEKEIKG